MPARPALPGRDAVKVRWQIELSRVISLCCWSYSEPSCLELRALPPPPAWRTANELHAHSAWLLHLPLPQQAQCLWNLGQALIRGLPVKGRL